ncbi:hypothetical protein B40_0416 [Lactococcus cremoris]|nr:hypothetical protein B40_0416 [Lactococcus cremoris]
MPVESVTPPNSGNSYWQSVSNFYEPLSLIIAYFSISVSKFIISNY